MTMTATTYLTITERRQQAAEVTGRPADQIRSIQVQLDVLRKQGLLIDLSIRGTSMFTRTASWAEIGIQADIKDPRFSRFTKGQKFLIPEEEIRALKSVETRMRYWLEKLSYGVTGFRPYRWLPYTAYQKWQTQWVELWKEFYAIKERIISNMDSYQDWLSDGFAEVAEASWKSIRANGYKYVTLNGRQMDHDSFVDYVVSSAISKLPTAAQVEENLHADYITALVYGDQDVAADQAQAEVIRARAQSKRERVSLQNSRQAEQVRHELAMHQLVEQERSACIEAMREAEARHAREQLRSIASPFEEVFTALRCQMSEDAAEMLSSIRKNGFVRGKIAEKGRGLIEMFNLLAVQDDHELRGRLEALKHAIGPIGDRTDAPERSTEDVKSILEQIMDLERSAAQDLLAGPNRFNMVDV
jgi:hypothetical protein